MPAQIIFLTLFLGIASGTQPLILEVTGPVHSVRVLLGGREVALMKAPPWETRIDIGADLTPRELTAIGYDRDGDEVARVSQMINLPRPTAEFDIVVDGNDVALHWRHLMNLEPEHATVALDDRPLTVGAQFHAKLPKIDREKTHILSAELAFPDGFVARRETVLEAALSASTATQLTPVGLRDTGKGHPRSWDDCLTRADGKPVRLAAVEKPSALVIAVRDPYPRTGLPSALEKWLTEQRKTPYWSIRNTTEFDRTTGVRILWSVAQQFSDLETSADLFEATAEFDASAEFGSSNGNVLFMLFTEYTGKAQENARRRFTDAVAVAGIRAVTAAQRRAVIYVLDDHDDASRNSPASVRRYLDTLGVPFFVWSRVGPYPTIASVWGPVDDISTYAKLATATTRVRRALDEQRIGWVDVDPLEALRLKASPRCGLETLASGARTQP